MLEIISAISIYLVPLIIVFIPLYGFIKGVRVYEAFTDGAADGFKTIYQIFPYLLAMIIAINVFQASGALDILVNLLKPITEKLYIPEQVLPLFFLRPLSGSGSLTYTNYLFSSYGPDTFIGKLASTIQGSTETTFYIIAVYFGAVGIKKYRYSVTIGLLADIAGFFAAVFICKLLFL